jgi:multimeric flavodoxin WrbA
MIEPVVTTEGQQALEHILNIWPPITREERKKKIFDALTLIMKVQGKKEAGKALVIEAAKLVLPKSFEPVLHGVEDAAKFKRLTLDPMNDIDAYNALPRQVKWWDTPASKPAKRPEEMKVMAFCASPRKGGNTDVLIDEALRGAKDAGAVGEKIRLQSLKLKLCLGCWKCKEPDFNGFCIQKDDMSDIYQKIVDSDAIIIGFPIYLGRECALLSVFLERWNGFIGFKHSSRLGPGRRALVIGTWGYPYDDTYDQVMANVIAILYQIGVETVEAVSACGFDGMLRGLDDKGKAVILRYPKELKKAYQAGKSLVTG